MSNQCPAPGRRLKTLLVEDSPSIQEALAGALQDIAALEWSGAAATAAEALAAFDLHRPDVVILDPALRTGGGVEVLREIRRRQPECQLLIFTAQDEEASRARCRAAGASHFFSKNRQRWQLIQHLRLLADAASPAPSVGRPGQPAAGSGPKNQLHHV